MITFKEYLIEKNKFAIRGPKRKFHFRPGRRLPHKELTDVLPASSRYHSATTLRSIARQSMTHIPQFHKVMYSGISASTEKLVKQAKQSAPGFVRRLTRKEVLEIASKYHLRVPNENKPIKHLGSTGIEIVRRARNMFFLVKSI